MRQAVVVLEFKSDSTHPDTMRWESAGTGPDKAFELLGRAFEVAQRETGEDFAVAVRAFFRGALIGREDAQGVLDAMK